MMQRQIKFRVWIEGKMQIPVYMRFSLTEGIPVMQYIGLHDSKRTEEYPEGQEIYEGDIVLCSGIGNNADEKYNAEVVFCEGKAAFMLDAGCELFSFTEMSELCEIEVIGNIFEDGDLLMEGTR